MTLPSPVINSYVEDSLPKIGSIVLSSDLTTELDVRTLIKPNEAHLYTNRVRFDNPVTPANLAKMSDHLADSSNILLPDIPLDIVLYSCTLGSVVIGDDEITKMVHKAKPTAQVITPTSASIRGLRALACERVALLTPYTVESTRPMQDYYQQHVDICATHAMGVADDREIARLDSRSIIEAAQALYEVANKPQAMFISCTGLRVIHLIEQIEQMLGITVISSNLASCWLMRQTLGCANLSGYGRLMRTNISL